MLLSDWEYKQTLRLWEQPFLRPALLRELIDWGREALDISIVNYICDRAETAGPRLRLILWDRSDRDKVTLHTGTIYGHDPQAQEAVARRFSALARKHGEHRAYWKTDSFFVTFDTFREELQAQLLRRARPALKCLVGDDVWWVEAASTAIHLFYRTDEQVRRHETDGTSEALRQTCGGIVARVDRWNVFPDGPPCHFTSRQTLEEQYEGNLYFYFL